MSGGFVQTVFGVCSLRCYNCSSNSNSASSMQKQTRFSFAVPVDFNCLPRNVFLDFKDYFLFRFVSRRDRISTAVFNLPAMCTIAKLNCGAKSYAFLDGGGNILVRMNCVTDLLSVVEE